jgi:DnaJ-class molecular chaperone
MAKRLRCQCGGNSGCKLCSGSGLYEYQPGPLGWQLFACPTCEGKGTVTGQAPESNVPCFTCRGAGRIDPVHAPSAGGIWDYLFKFFFGA